MAKYIVLLSSDVGGAERRFVDIFKSMSKVDDSVKLVLSLKLYLLLFDEDEYDNVICIGSKDDGFKKYVLNYCKWLIFKTNKNDVFHYPLNCLFFLHIIKRSKTIFSITDCYAAPHVKSLKISQIRQHITLFFVNKIDVLSPTVYKSITNYRFIGKEKIYLTPNGTYVYPNDNYIYKKELKIGFLGRLIEGKGVDDYLTIVSNLWSDFGSNYNISFYIAGYGNLEGKVESEVKKLAHKGVPIQFIGKVDSKEILASTSLIFSLQNVTNYPSRVIAESLLSGATVFVRNSGDTALFGELPGLIYLDDDLKYEMIKKLFNSFLSNEFKDDSLEIQKAARERFSSPLLIDYMLDLFNF